MTDPTILTSSEHSQRVLQLVAGRPVTFHTQYGQWRARIEYDGRYFESATTLTITGALLSLLDVIAILGLYRGSNHMTPTVGRIVHLTTSAEQTAAMGRPICRAAIVTGVENSKISGGEPYFYASAYSYRGDQSAVIVREPSAWHDPRECPYAER